MSAVEVVVAGSYNHDHVWRTPHFPVPGETRLGEFSAGPGGKGFNQAVAAARQGARTAFIAAFGVDAIGDGALALAVTEGLVPLIERRGDAATGTAAILLDGNGQNLIVVGPGANARLSVDHIEVQDDVIGTARVLVTQHEVNMAATERALQLARRAGTLTLHNPAPPLADENGALLALVDILTPNETEFAHLIERIAGERLAAERVAGIPAVELHVLCRKLGVPTVVVTLGANGVFVSHDEQDLRGDDAAFYRLPVEAGVAVRDTTGAGDAFTGSLAAALARNGGPFKDAVAHANRCAALAVEREGAALAMPLRAEVAKRFG